MYRSSNSLGRRGAELSYKNNDEKSRVSAHFVLNSIVIKTYCLFSQPYSFVTVSQYFFYSVSSTVLFCLSKFFHAKKFIKFLEYELNLQ